jgi:hypothetical protein
MEGVLNGMTWNIDPSPLSFSIFETKKSPHPPPANPGDEMVRGDF